MNRSVRGGSLKCFKLRYIKTYLLHFLLLLQSDRALEEEDWFHGVMPREDVQRLLVHNGDYLAREGRNRKTGEKQYVLSVMWNGHKHFIIQGVPVSHHNKIVFIHRQIRDCCPVHGCVNTLTL